MHGQPPSEHLLRDFAPHAQAADKGPNRALDGVPVGKHAISPYSSWLESVISEAKWLAAATTHRAPNILAGCGCVLMKTAAGTDRYLSDRKRWLNGGHSSPQAGKILS